MLKRAALGCVTLTLFAVVGVAAEPKVPAELEPRLCTLKGSMTVAAALKELAKQTGNTVADWRTEAEERPIKLALDKATFWQALDAIAREADARVSIYNRDRVAALVGGRYHEVPVSYSGLFRTTIKRVAVVRDLETQAHFGSAVLEVAWEPRITAYYLELQGKPQVQDDRGGDLPLQRESRGKMSVDNPHALQFEVHFDAPPRKSAQLGLLKGELDAVVSGQNLVFTFDQFTLKDAGNQTDKLVKVVSLTKENVAVTLNRFDANHGTRTWRIGLSLLYPAGGPELESFQSTLGDSATFLVKQGRRLAANGGNSINQEGNRANGDYIFVEENGLLLGKPNDWVIEYHTPSSPHRLPLRFEFKDVPLP